MTSPKSSSPAPIASTPEPVAGMGFYTFTWTPEDVILRLNHLRERGDTVSAEIEVCYRDGRHLYGGDRLSLTNGEARAKLAKRLALIRNGLPWEPMFQQASIETLRHYRQGEAPVLVGATLRRAVRPWRLWPIIPLGNTAILFGPGGSLKSTLAALFALLVQAGETTKGLRPQQGNALVLDWETDEDDFNDLCWGLREGLCLLEKFQPLYRRCLRPLAEDAEAIQEIILARKIDTVFVDSAMLAAGGTRMAKEDCASVFATLRAFGTSNLVVAHEVKDPNAPPKPYGDVFWENLARHLLQVKCVDNADLHLHEIGLYNTKTNWGPKLPPLGFQLAFTDDRRITVETQDPNEVPELADKLPAYAKLRLALKHGSLSIANLSEQTGLAQDFVRSTMNRYKNLFVNLESSHGKIGCWGLRIQEEETA